MSTDIFGRVPIPRRLLLDVIDDLIELGDDPLLELEQRLAILRIVGRLTTAVVYRDDLEEF